MTARLVGLCFDANDPLRLAQFWAEALDWEIHHENCGQTSLAPTDGTKFRIRLFPVLEKKVSKNSIHLDLSTSSIDDQTELIAELIEPGNSTSPPTMVISKWRWTAWWPLGRLESTSAGAPSIGLSCPIPMATSSLS
jgi:hypothetical protein